MSYMGPNPPLTRGFSLSLRLVAPGGNTFRPRNNIQLVVRSSNNKGTPSFLHFVIQARPSHSLDIFSLMVGCCYQEIAPDSIYYSLAWGQCTATKLQRTTSINLQQSFKLILVESCNDPQSLNNF